MQVGWQGRGCICVWSRPREAACRCACAASSRASASGRSCSAWRARTRSPAGCGTARTASRSISRRTRVKEGREGSRRSTPSSASLRTARRRRRASPRSSPHPRRSRAARKFTIRESEEGEPPPCAISLLPAPLGPMTPRHSPRADLQREVIDDQCCRRTSCQIRQCGRSARAWAASVPNERCRAEAQERASVRWPLSHRPCRPTKGAYSAVSRPASASTGSGRSTSSTNAIGALSPTRKPIFRMRV